MSILATPSSSPVPVLAAKAPVSVDRLFEREGGHTRFERLPLFDQYQALRWIRGLTAGRADGVALHRLAESHMHFLEVSPAGTLLPRQVAAVEALRAGLETALAAVPASPAGAGPLNDLGLILEPSPGSIPGALPVVAADRRLARAPIHDIMDRLLRDGPDPRPPESFTVDGTAVTDLDDPRVAERLGLLFGHSVTPRELVRGFRVEIRHQPDWHVASLRLTAAPGRLHVAGDVADAHGQSIASFLVVIPRFESAGEPWTVNWAHFNHPEDTPALKPVTGGGIARSLLQHAFALFRSLGVDAVRTSATLAGAYVWPHLGFDFMGNEARDVAKIRFMEWFSRNGIVLSRGEEGRVAALSHADELADFTLDDGRAIGRTALLDPFSNIWSEALWFPLSVEQGGWGSLYKMRFPVEWERLDDATRCLLMEYVAAPGIPPRMLGSVVGSDERHGMLWAERFNNWGNNIHNTVAFRPPPEEVDDEWRQMEADTRPYIDHVAGLFRMLAPEQEAASPLWQSFTANLTGALRAVFGEIRAEVLKVHPDITMEIEAGVSRTGTDLPCDDRRV